MTWDSYLKEVLERAEKATPGPWERYNGSIVRRKKNKKRNTFPTVLFASYDGELMADDNDLNFIAHSRTDVERLAKHCMELRVLLKYFYDNPDWDVNTDQIEDLLKKEVE